MSDVTVSKIYLFLANQEDWRTDANINGDEEITQGEMREYLSGSDFEDFVGCSITDVSAKVFNDFWNRLDKNINNFTLDDSELNRAQGQILTVKYAKEYVATNCTNAPAGINKDDWQDEIVEALDNDILKFLNTTDIFDNLPNFLEELDDKMKTAIAEGLSGALEGAKTTATIQCYIDNYTKETENNAEIKALKDFGYSLSKDDDLTKIINNWMKQNTETDPTKIQEAIKNLIEGYLKTANIGSGDVKVLEGNSAYKPSKLNELQMAKLKKDAKSVFGSSLKDKASSFSIEGANGAIDLTGGGYDGIYRKYVDEFLNSYFESGYKSATRTDGQSLFDAALNELRTKGFDLFKASKAGENFITEIQFADNYRFAWENKDFFGEIVKTGIDGVDESGNLVTGSDLATLKEWLNNDCGEGKFPEYYAAYNKILASLQNPYDNTYRKANGAINYDKINSELIELVKIKFGIVTKTSSSDGTTGSTSTSESKVEEMSLAGNSKVILNGQSVGNILSSPFALQTSFVKPDNIIGTATGAINEYIDSLANALIAAGYDSNTVNEAADVAKQYYQFVISEIKEMCYTDTDFKSGTRNSTKGSTCTKEGKKEKDGYASGNVIKSSYRSSSGKIVEMEASGFGWYSKKHEKDTGSASNRASADNTGISVAHSWNGKDTYRIYYNVAAIIKNFEKIFNQLI